MDYLRQGIHLRGYAQQDYRYEYKREAFQLFSAMLDRVKFDTVSRLTTVEIRTPEQLEREEAERRERLMRALQAQHAELIPVLGGADLSMPPQGPPVSPTLGMPGAGPGIAFRPRSVGSLGGAGAGPGQGVAAGAGGAAVAPFVRDGRKVGRNEPCPCGSGKKYKHCHGALASSQ
jgi:preprotein translocase subunit SecA